MRIDIRVLKAVGAHELSFKRDCIGEQMCSLCIIRNSLNRHSISSQMQDINPGLDGRRVRVSLFVFAVSSHLKMRMQGP